MQSTTIAYVGSGCYRTSFSKLRWTQAKLNTSNLILQQLVVWLFASAKIKYNISNLILQKLGVCLFASTILVMSALLELPVRIRDYARDISWQKRAIVVRGCQSKYDRYWKLFNLLLVKTFFCYIILTIGDCGSSFHLTCYYEVEHQLNTPKSLLQFGVTKLSCYVKPRH